MLGRDVHETVRAHLLRRDEPEELIEQFRCRLFILQARSHLRPATLNRLRPVVIDGVIVIKLRFAGDVIIDAQSMNPAKPGKTPLEVDPDA